MTAKKSAKGRTKKSTKSTKAKTVRTRAKGPAETRSKKPAKKGEPGPTSLRREIEKKAYELYAKKGFQHGSDVTDWLEAEKQVVNRMRG
jgi:hypothetical protein